MFTQKPNYQVVLFAALAATAAIAFLALAHAYRGMQFFW